MAALKIGLTVRKGELYYFKCKYHGIVKSYPHGWKEYLICDKCLQEDYEQHLNEIKELDFDEEFEELDNNNNYPEKLQ